MKAAKTHSEKHKIRCREIPEWKRVFDKEFLDRIKKFGSVEPEALSQELLLKLGYSDPARENQLMR